MNTRRHFITTASLASLSAMSSAADSTATIRIGNIGCGSRGTFVSDIIREHSGFTLSAAADYFKDAVDAFGSKFAVPEAKRFTGLAGYQAMFEHVDAVAIHSPPWFHVQQAVDAVAAGKHVLIAKPVAIDVAGCEVIRKLAVDAAAKGLVVMADVQCRGDAFFNEGIKRVREGAIGPLTFGQCNYEADLLPLKPGGTDTPEGRLRNWFRFRDLGGDIITEQNIHALDIISWAYGRPRRVSAHSGRDGRPDTTGDVSSHYSVLFEFEHGAITFGSRQFSAWGSPFLCDNRFVGTKGVFTSKFGGRVMIRGNKEVFWAGGETKDLYRSGSVNNVAQFHQAIVSGNPGDNATVEAAVESTLLTLFAEAAAKAGRTLSWEEFLNTSHKAYPDLSGLHS